MINVLYFARLREQLGAGSEGLEAVPEIATLGDIVSLLSARGGVWTQVFSGDQPVMMALNQEMCGADAAVRDGDEVAFFPPVTGG
jgi:molybdopterin synthase sulfur carrier subunit